MQRSFLQSYLEAFHRIEGWFSYDAALMFMAYNHLLAAAGIRGDVLEIGVYHGLSAIGIASLRRPGSKFYAIDLFEHLQSGTGYGSGAGYRKIFEENMKSFYGDLNFVVTIASASGTLRGGDLAPSFSFCHVDGGHSPRETYEDMKFASEILMPGGLLALDDYFNPQYPGVCEGALDFARRHAGVLQPVAIGYNKVLYQKAGSGLKLNELFASKFPAVQYITATMWETPIPLYGEPLRRSFDIYASRPDRMVPLGSAGIRAKFSTKQQRYSARPGEAVSVPVTVKNTSNEAFPAGEDVFGLSYHLLSADGQTIAHDNARTYCKGPMPPGSGATMDLKVAAPSTAGNYQIEIDLVWEGVMWFKDIGNPTCTVTLEVR